LKAFRAFLDISPIRPIVRIDPLKKNERRVPVKGFALFTLEGSGLEQVLRKERTNMKIDLNSTNEMELMKIEGLSKERAQAIINYRDQHGRFQSWDDLKNIPGFSDTLVSVLKRSGATFGGKKAA